jgi:hypothetical protein
MHSPILLQARAAAAVWLLAMEIAGFLSGRRHGGDFPGEHTVGIQLRAHRKYSSKKASKSDNNGQCRRRSATASHNAVTTLAQSSQGSVLFKPGAPLLSY